MVALDKTGWRAVSAELDELLEADRMQRAARLSQLQARDPVLAEQVWTLLARQARVEAERFLEGTPFDPAGPG